MTAQDQQSGRDSLEAVFLRERARLLAFLRRVGASDDAEDLLHEAWIKVRALDRPVPAEPLSYLFRLLHNLVIDRRRSAQRDVRRDTHWADLSGAFGDRSEEPDGERHMLAVDEVRAVHDALDRLGEPTAGIFRRHRLQDMPQRAIAAELGMGLSTVEKHLRRAYAMLTAFRSAHDDV